MRSNTTPLQARRDELGLTLAQVAAQCGETCRQGSVSQWERLITEPRGVTRAAYAIALQMPLDEMAAIFWRASAQVMHAQPAPTGEVA